jgi:site-specific DNA recombinase
MKIADLYIRVSTDEQADKGYSQRNQEEVLRRYCEINSIRVRKVVYEDYSAKTFLRPAWCKLLVEVQKDKGQSDLILFTKWDRFSRNAGDAYQMINILRKASVEPQAVEQPLDLSVPENKMMLAIYLAAPEVENDRRALNVFHGMRRAKKEGRWMGTAPVGYINKINENGRKYIAPKEPEATLIRWVFEQLACGKFATEQIWKHAKEKGLKCSKNNFWVAIRNPVYCGKICIPKFKDEDRCFVKGQHEPIISEALFYEVQDVLNGKRKQQRAKMVVDDSLPLRGFLICPKCGRLLTGSASKGKYQRYYYYHCSSSCGCRYRATNLNDLFVRELRKYVPRKSMIELYKLAINSKYKAQTKAQRDDKMEILTWINEWNNKLVKARELLLSGDIDGGDYRIIKSDCENKINILEQKLSFLGDTQENIDAILDKAVNTLSRLDTLYENATSLKKREIISSIFPEKLVFDGFNYRTTRINEAVRLIYNMDAAFEENKNGTNDNLSHLSHQVIWLGLEPRTHTLKVYCSTN